MKTNRSKKIKIALSGACGKMGRVVSDLAAEFPICSIYAGIDVAGEKYADFEIYRKVSDLEETPDVIIDFSHPLALSDMLSFCRMRGVPVVIATTGYSDDDIAEIKAASALIPVFFTFNMSLGINLLADLARRATRVLGGRFDVEIIDKHHNYKKDAPSGTAIMLAETVNKERNSALKYVYSRNSVRKSREKDELGIHSIRGGTIVGEHEIIFAGHDEIISLSHSALSKEVFASGAINAALFLAKREKGLYDMSDLLSYTI
ncbi:MAG: 4-hydroxy-tetrahydrodipicolinate reductase [Oscillospiraceae bacterium]|nr:4-hydroxy-tetrahydrodipicolinate reductase [Oscillospiraceae bacterium]